MGVSTAAGGLLGVTAGNGLGVVPIAGTLGLGGTGTIGNEPILGVPPTGTGSGVTGGNFESDTSKAGGVTGRDGIVGIEGTAGVGVPVLGGMALGRKLGTSMFGGGICVPLAGRTPSPDIAG